MIRIALAAAFTAVVAFPAAAQNGSRFASEEQLAANYGSVGENTYASGLPGVGLNATQTTERPSGPGGLSNGVGAVGTLMPNSSSSNGQLLNDEGQGVGIPLASPRRDID